VEVVENTFIEQQTTKIQKKLKNGWWGRTH